MSLLVERVSLENSLNYILKEIVNIRIKNKSKEDFDTVYILFKCAFKLVNIEFPNSDFKFKVNDPNIRIIFHRLIDELVILAFYINYKETALLVSDKMIFDENCLLNKNQVISNQRYYTTPLTIIKKGMFSLKLNGGLSPLNPCILKLDDGYLVNCRIVNYQINNDGIYTINNPNGTIITENITLKVDKDFNIVSECNIKDLTTIQRYSGRNIIGLEDLILFIFKDSLWFTCTSLDTNPHGLPQINLCKLKYNIGLELPSDLDILKRCPINLPNNRSEKNWLPFIHNGELLLIYEYHPFTIKKILGDIEGNLNTEDHLKEKYDLNLSRFKGSAAPIDFENGYLFMVHETFNLSQSLRCYLHRFMWMDEDLKLKKMSHPWYFTHHGIEFCRSMCWSHTPDEIVLTYSIHDKDAQWCSVSIGYIRNLLHDLNYFNF